MAPGESLQDLRRKSSLHWGGILETPAYAQQEGRGQVEGTRAFSELGSQGVSRNASKRHGRVVEVRAATASTAKPSDSSGMTCRTEHWTPRCMLPAASWQPLEATVSTRDQPWTESNRNLSNKKHKDHAPEKFWWPFHESQQPGYQVRTL